MKSKHLLLILTISLSILFVLSLFSSPSICNEKENLEENVNMKKNLEATDSDITNKTKNLIAYFTWADNTVVENPDKIDVDAVTSASVIAPGNTAKIARYIQAYTGGDLFSIVTVNSYPSDYDKCLDRAADEKARDARPELSEYLKNINDYEVIYLGYPNWWYTVPMAIFSFLEAHDLSDKTIVPFCAHGTGGLASSIRDIQSKLPSATILEPFGVYRPNVDGSKENVGKWLNKIGMIK